MILIRDDDDTLGTLSILNSRNTDQTIGKVTCKRYIVGILKIYLLTNAQQKVCEKYPSPTLLLHPLPAANWPVYKVLCTLSKEGKAKSGKNQMTDSL